MSVTKLFRFGCCAVESSRATFGILEHLPDRSTVWVPAEIPKIDWSNCDVEDKLVADDNNEADDWRYEVVQPSDQLPKDQRFCFVEDDFK